MSNEQDNVGVTVSDLELLAHAFKLTGIKFSVVDERETEWAHPIPHASVKYVAIGVAHLHFDGEGKYLGIECEGDGGFVPTTI